MCIRDRQETAREDFAYVVPDFRRNKAFAQLETLARAEKDKVEFLCNECCWTGCRDRRRCYEAVSYTHLSELLGSQTEMVQLTQTGAIDFVVASNAIMETFSSQYQIFNLPYLFSSEEAYHAAMEDNEVTDRCV